MRFPSQERFLQYCVSKRRTYLRLLFERRNPRGFFDLWNGEFAFAASRSAIDDAQPEQADRLGLQLRWLLLQDLHQVVRSVVPDFAPVPPTVVATLPGAMHQVRVARSMLIAGEAGTGKEQLAILLHVLAGRPGAMVRLAAPELRDAGGSNTRQLMPERGSVFISEFEEIDEAAQEELLLFLNREARRRDLLFFVATRREPRDLVGRHRLRRDLFVRVSQTEVRLPPVEPSSQDVRLYVGDVLFDLVRVPADRLPELRSEARELGERWGRGMRGGVSSSYDFFAEALSYVMWREKKEIASTELARPWCEEIGRERPAKNYRELCERIADGFDRNASHPADEDRFGAAPNSPIPRSTRTAPPASESVAAPDANAVPTQLTRDELLRAYYRALLREERGDLRRVAARAGRRLRILHAELARLDVRIPVELRGGSPSSRDA